MPDARTEELLYSNAVGGCRTDDVVVQKRIWDTCGSDEIRGVAYLLERRGIKVPDSQQQAPFWRYIAFQRLKDPPQKTPDMQHMFLNNVHGADIEWVYMAAGIYTPTRIGVVQVYGAAAEDWDQNSAREKALAAGRLLHDVFPRSPLVNLSLELGETILEELTGLSEVTTLRGYPDSRTVRNTSRLLSAFGLQSNFLFVTTAASVHHTVLSDGLQYVNRKLSRYKSRQSSEVSWGTTGAGTYTESRQYTEDVGATRKVKFYSDLQTIWGPMEAAGGFLTTVCLFTDCENRKVGSRNLETAFYSPNVPIPISILHVNPINAQDVSRLRQLAKVCMSSVKLCDSDQKGCLNLLALFQHPDPIDIGFRLRYSTILPAHMSTVYMAPNVR